MRSVKPVNVRLSDDPEAVFLADLADAVRWTVAVMVAGLAVGYEETMRKIKSYYPVTLEIDDESVKLHIRRMSTVEIDDFEASMRGFGYSFDGSKIVPGQARDSKAMAAWLVQVVTANVSVPAGQLSIEDEDGNERELRTGADLIATYGGRVDFVPTLIAFIWGENRLPESRKAKFRQIASNAVQLATGGAAVPMDVVVPEPEGVTVDMPTELPPPPEDPLAPANVAAAVAEIRLVNEEQPTLL